MAHRPDILEIPSRAVVGEPRQGTGRQDQKVALRGASSSVVRGGDTVWIGVGDKQGNAVSLIQSIAHGSAGYHAGWNRRPSAEPRKILRARQDFRKPGSSRATLLSYADCRNVVQGWARRTGLWTRRRSQPQTQQPCRAHYDYGMSPQDAIEARAGCRGRMLDLSQPARC